MLTLRETMSHREWERFVDEALEGLQPTPPRERMVWNDDESHQNMNRWRSKTGVTMEQWMRDNHFITGPPSRSTGAPAPITRDQRDQRSTSVVILSRPVSPATDSEESIPEWVEKSHKMMKEHGIYSLLGEPVPKKITLAKSGEMKKKLGEYKRQIKMGVETRAETLKMLRTFIRSVSTYDDESIEESSGANETQRHADYEKQLEKIHSVWKAHRIYDTLEVAIPNRTPTAQQMVLLREKMMMFVKRRDLTIEDADLFLKVLEEEEMGEESEEWENEESVEVDATLDDANAIETQYISGAEDIIPGETRYKNSGKEEVTVRVKGLAPSYHRKVITGANYVKKYPIRWENDAMFVDMEIEYFKYHFKKVRILEAVADSDSEVECLNVKKRRIAHSGRPKRDIVVTYKLSS
ncbi:hypothetical protein PRIPAC_97726 [Pristionchus pacificus]|uniref:Uncharacterized protein n=1 Tax=Pristionchus pacificus TaxID=54126 RepID=A0A2A6CUQ6_PRIPA|nr:hypothetical protein PRIPAC_97726 [Pristionchus pacificus]|eukprot:PDM81830.1 hypothetical protein PRIPAC_33984 [Pristionchus pacificus]